MYDFLIGLCLILLMFMALVARFAGVQYVWEGIKTLFFSLLGGLIMILLLFLILRL